MNLVGIVMLGGWSTSCCQGLNSLRDAVFYSCGHSFFQGMTSEGDVYRSNGGNSSHDNTGGEQRHETNSQCPLDLDLPQNTDRGENQ